jgi:hypothetical protein
VSEKIAFWRTNSNESKSSTSPKGVGEISPRAAKQAFATKSSGSWNDRSRQGFVGMGGVGMSHSEEFRRKAEDFQRPEKKGEVSRTPFRRRGRLARPPSSIPLPFPRDASAVSTWQCS